MANVEPTKTDTEMNTEKMTTESQAIEFITKSGLYGEFAAYVNGADCKNYPAETDRLISIIERQSRQLTRVTKSLSFAMSVIDAMGLTMPPTPSTSK